MIEAGLVTEADVRQTHAAIGIGAVVVGTTEGVRRDGGKRRAAVEAMFRRSIAGLVDWWIGGGSGKRGRGRQGVGSESRGLGTFRAARARWEGAGRTGGSGRTV